MTSGPTAAVAAPGEAEAGGIAIGLLLETVRGAQHCLCDILRQLLLRPG
jgi:hypothetical protein